MVQEMLDEKEKAEAERNAAEKAEAEKAAAEKKAEDEDNEDDEDDDVGLLDILGVVMDVTSDPTYEK